MAEVQHKCADYADFWKKKVDVNEQSVGEYKVMNTIGVGAFGKVKLGIHKTTFHEVAIKQLSVKYIREMKAESKVTREIRNLKLFHHPHIIRLYQIVKSPTDIFMIMEYAPRGELFEFILKNGKLLEAETRKYFQQIISAVHYCHRHMVVHRDLKPENLLLDANLNLKVADFGLSIMIPDGEFLKTSCGSPNYAAPEVLSGRLYAGPEVDIWSCGVILYTLLVGKLPFDHPNRTILFHLITKGEFKLPARFDPNAASLITGMLDVDPLKRIGLKTVIENPWFRKDLSFYLFPQVSEHDSSAIDLRLATVVGEKLNIDLKKVESALLENNIMEPTVMAYKVLLDREQQEKHLSLSKKKNRYCRGNNKTCLLPGQKFCRQDCEMCPRWGASECLFAKVIPTLEQCDTCEHLGDKGCVFNGFSETSNKQQQQGMREIEDTVVIPTKKNTSPIHLYTPKISKARIISLSMDKERWHLGIRANCSPVEIMLEVYRVLKKRGFLWKTYNPYHVLIKSDTDERMRVVIQLFQMETSGTYLLDFKSETVVENLKNPSESIPPSEVIRFFDMSSSIIQGLGDED